MTALAEIVMPKLGLTMTEGLLAEWRVQPGARVAAGDILFVVETEKIATDIEASGDGEIVELLVAAGSTVPVGMPVARWTGAAAGAPEAPRAAEPAQPAAAPLPAASGGRILATPLARRLARERGVDLTGVSGSGPRGRIKAKDVPEARAQVPASAAVPTAGEFIALDRVRAASARRLTQAKQEIPHFYVGAAAEISRLLALRDEWRDIPDAPRMTVTHAVLAAIGRALHAMPELNRVWEGEGWRRLSSPDVGLAVDTPRGLFAPVLHDAGRLSLGTVASRANGLVERARAGRLSPDELRGGSITLSNVGMHGARFLVPIVNPGQSMILGLGAMESLFRPDAEGAPALRREITLVLAADHRVLDGAAAAAFLARIVAFLEKPLALLIAPAEGSI
ncbi:dihydrolipoamide acetyltransferase family protein [Neoroseomonas soli]|uniref:Dihydrolipoamide acetyltransferase component of pyruvate dehydrogenase complex n=1 Tax=Neoroseomonas soli TaxID=1081025 RepID=A0A9X9WWY9_9PROT|nr:dihydrolipoamide acetyltransferase family protein [Neoroseomonas soli]MBR0671668.1 2-oxo acid dehydrogenase subunit E2 [Neoroseomonas soli]